MATSSETKDGIGQVREILVGAIQRDLDRRITKLETIVGQKLAEQQQEVRRRMEVIEGHLRKEIETLSARVQAELFELKDGVRAVTREQRETQSASEQRVAKLEETEAHAQRDLRSQILDQAKSFLDELHQMRDEFAETLEREIGFEPESGSAEESKPREQRQGDSPGGR
jgi:hypothetical protein